MRWILVFVMLLGAAGCVYAASSTVLPDLLMVALPAGRVEAGEGKLDEAAQKRLAARKQAALGEAARDAIAAAEQAPGDLRLQRRAAAMVREAAAGERALDAHAIEPVLARLAEGAPCPGLADVGATYRALGEHGRAGDLYVRAARLCGSVDAAIAAVAPLKAAGRCDDAVAVLRAMWPKVEIGHRESWIAVLDGVAACSDALTLRRNLGFAPEDIVADYFDLLAARERQAEEDRRRAEAERLQQEADSRAREASWRCESECGAAVSSCESSCSGEVHCLERCSAVSHVCRAGCGGS